METEIKFSILPGDLMEYGSLLSGLGAVSVESFDQEDVYYSHPKLDAVYRLRKNEATCSSYLRKNNVLFTVKDCADKKSTIKIRVEKETYVTSYETVIELMKVMGFSEDCRISKDPRLSYKLDGCRVELDFDVKIYRGYRLGSFLEIEGPTKKAIRVVMKKLNLKEEDAVKESYYQLAAEIWSKKNAKKKVKNKRT